MTKRKLFSPLFALGFAVVLAACSSLGEVPASLETQAQPSWVSVVATFPSIEAPCLEEALTASVTVNFRNMQKVTPNGRSLFKQVARPDVARADALVVGQSSGMTYSYRLVGAHQITDILDEGEDRVYIFTNSIRLIGQGQHPNLQVNFRIRYIVNANGDTVVFEGMPPSWEATCTGRI